MYIQKKKKEFSKLLLIQESALIWLLTIAFVVLAFICVMNGYLGTLPWLTAMAGFPWTAYGISQAFYYNKSKAENTCGGVVYDSAISQKQTQQEYPI